jgi:hypothetical protein
MQKKKSGGGGGGDGAEKKKEEGPVTVVLKIDMHCEGCASKIVKTLKGFQGNNTPFPTFLCKISFTNFDFPLFAA